MSYDIYSLYFVLSALMEVSIEKVFYSQSKNPG